MKKIALKQIALITLAVIIYGWFNVCLFTVRTAAAEPVKAKIAYETCAAHRLPPTKENLNRPALPLPECCLEQNHNFNALITVADDNAPVGASATVTLTADSNIQASNDNFSELTYPPPIKLALASVIIRE